MRKFLFILSGNLSTSPRALKAIRLLSSNNDVDILYINRSNQWLEYDKAIELPDNVNCSYLNLGRKPIWPWLFVTTLEKLSQLFYTLFKNHIDVNAFASNKSSIMLWLFQRKIRKPDFHLIAGHGAGALYPAWRLSNKWNIPFIFDVEDYHPGEYIRRDAQNEKQRREYLMKKLLPKARAITSASPLIEEYTLKLIGGHSMHQVILNSFPETEFRVPKIVANPTSKLRLVWFSQKISFGRGLEELFDAFTTSDNSLSTFLQLTLIGDMDEQFYHQVIYPAVQRMQGFTFEHLPPMSQAELHAEISNHDIGLALEFDTTDLNRKLSLTNKIWAYLQAGLFILATNTPAQKLFMAEHPSCGLLVDQNISAVHERNYRFVKTEGPNPKRGGQPLFHSTRFFVGRRKQEAQKGFGRSFFTIVTIYDSFKR